MKTLKILILVLAFSSIGFAQEVISSSGNFEQNSNGSLSYTIGEPVTETFSTNNNTLTQGFQQSKITVTAIESFELDNINISVYPNPSDSFVFIKVQSATYSEFVYHLFDINGKVISTEKSTDKITELDTKSLPNGTYLLKIEFDKSLNKTFKIIKK
jgi:hypothetical protein